MSRPTFTSIALVALTLVPGCGAGDRETATPFPLMHAPRIAHTQTRLRDGRVLLAGGVQHLKQILPPANTDVEIYDPDTHMFTIVARTTTVRAFHTATLLDDGRVVFIGGSPGHVIEVCDVDAAAVTPAGNIRHPRMMHTATLLTDGRILIVGGMTEEVTYADGTFKPRYAFLDSVEIYDPRSGDSVDFPVRLAVRRRGHTATLLSDGRVFIIGGSRKTATALIDVAAGTITPGPPLKLPREDHRTTRLDDGRLLVSGGTSPQGVSLDAAEVYDPATGEFRLIEHLMVQRREDHTANLLPDGRVLITGGEDNHSGKDQRDLVLDNVEVFDPATETFSKLPSLIVRRDEHASSVLDDGRVLITGGADDNEYGHHTAEILSADAAD